MQIKNMSKIVVKFTTVKFRDSGAKRIPVKKLFLKRQKIDVRRGYGPSAAADAKEIHMNMHVF